MDKYNIVVPESIITLYQNYINKELYRGLKRGGVGYNFDNLDLKKYHIVNISVKTVPKKSLNAIMKRTEENRIKRNRRRLLA